MNEVKIHLFDITNQFYEKIFPEKGESIQKNYGIITTRKFTKDYPKYKCKWIGYKYPILSKDNINNILNDLIDSLKQSNNKNNIFIKFGVNYVKAFRKMSNYLDFDLPFILFNFSENDELENDFFKKFKYPQYISYIQDKYDPSIPDLNYQKILSYIWEKDCYYNERGNSSCYYSPANLLYKPSKGFIFCNILIIGEPRAGKSTFINRLFNKYISYESCKFESVTKEINYYKYICSDNEFEENKLIKNKFGFIRVIDTPGLIHNTYAKIISELDEEFNNIHLIYFFMKGQSNIEQCINTLKYINDKNKEKIKNKAYKVPIIFIKNGGDLINGGNVNILSKELKNVLKKNNLMDLYDNNFKKKDYLNDYNNYIDGNIIQIHLPTGKNLNKLFLISKNYILKNNSTILEGKLNDEYEIMEKNTNSLIKIYIKEKILKKPLTKRDQDLFSKLINDGKNFAHKLQKSGNILYDLEILNIKTKSFFSSIFKLFDESKNLFTSEYINHIFPDIIYFKEEIKDLIYNIALSYGFDKNDIYKYGLDKFIFEEKFLENLSNENREEKIKKFFENLIDYIGPIQYAIKTREALIQINDIFDKLSNRKDEEWIKFQVKKI